MTSKDIQKIFKHKSPHDKHKGNKMEVGVQRERGEAKHSTVKHGLVAHFHVNDCGC